MLEFALFNRIIRLFLLCNMIFVKSQNALRYWENFNIAGSGAFLYLAASSGMEICHVFFHTFLARARSLDI